MESGTRRESVDTPALGLAAALRMSGGREAAQTFLAGLGRARSLSSRPLIEEHLTAPR